MGLLCGIPLSTVREGSKDILVTTFTPTPDLAAATPALHWAETVTPSASPLQTDALKTGQADSCTRSEVVRQLIV